MKTIKNISALFTAIILAFLFTFTISSCGGDEAVQPKQPDPVVVDPGTGKTISADSIVSLLNNREWKTSVYLNVYRFSAQLGDGISVAGVSYQRIKDDGQWSSETSLIPHDKTFTVFTESRVNPTGNIWYLLSVVKEGQLLKMNWKITSNNNPDRFLTFQAEL